MNLAYIGDAGGEQDDGDFGRLRIGTYAGKLMFMRYADVYALQES